MYENREKIMKFRLILIVSIIFLMICSFLPAAEIQDAVKAGDVVKIKDLLAKDPELIKSISGKVTFKSSVGSPAPSFVVSLLKSCLMLFIILIKKSLKLDSFRDFKSS